MMRRLKALGATVVLLVLVVGIPLAMAATISNPVRGWAGLKTGAPTDQALIDLLAVVVWLAWAQFAVAWSSNSVPRYGTCRHRPVSRWCPGSSQHLADTLVTAALLIRTATAVLAYPVPAQPPTTHTPTHQTPSPEHHR